MKTKTVDSSELSTKSLSARDYVPIKPDLTVVPDTPKRLIVVCTKETAQIAYELVRYYSLVDPDKFEDFSVVNLDYKAAQPVIKEPTAVFFIGDRAARVKDLLATVESSDAYYRYLREEKK